MARTLLLLCISFLHAFSGFTQDIPVGSWRNHFSFESIQLVASDGNRTFASSQFALFLFEDEEITRLSKIDGLNGGAVTGLAYQAESDVLLIGYEDGGIDLIQGGILQNLTDLTDGNFGTNRSINGFAFENDLAFAATNFGVASINLNTLEITEIFREIGPNGDILQIKEIFSQNGILYAASDRGILSGNLSSNLLDFNNWSLSANSTGFQNLISFENEVIASKDSVIFSWDMQFMSWDTLTRVNYEIKDLAVAQGQLFVLGSNELQELENDNFADVEINFLTSASELIFNQGEFWIADLENGLINGVPGNERLILPSGPASDDITHIEFADNLYAFYSTSPGSEQEDSTGFAVFSDGQWENPVVDEFYNISDVAIHDGSVFLSSNTQGIYDLSNEQLIADVFSEEVVSIPALAGTSNGLYAARYNHSNALYRLNEGSWESWSAAEVGSTTLVDIQFSEGNVIWLTNDNSRGIIAFDPIGEQVRVINQSDGLASSTIRSVAIDLDDQAWIGTTSGVSFFLDATFVFDNFSAFTPFFENRVLFENEAVTAMAVDGGNRKWMATKDGIWVFDSNVTTLESRFTAANSPLPSNNIQEFAYNPTSGEMFILTDRGLVSYRTGSSAGRARHGNVQILPNPIRPQDPGPVTLRGLAQDANIKITDVQGNLIREVDALGGTATWDLRDTSGNSAASGIYLFFSSVGGREETFVGKIAVIR